MLVIMVKEVNSKNFNEFCTNLGKTQTNTHVSLASNISQDHIRKLLVKFEEQANERRFFSHIDSPRLVGLLVTSIQERIGSLGDSNSESSIKSVLSNLKLLYKMYPFAQCSSEYDLSQQIYTKIINNDLGIDRSSTILLNFERILTLKVNSELLDQPAMERIASSWAFLAQQFVPTKLEAYARIVAIYLHIEAIFPCYENIRELISSAEEKITNFSKKNSNASTQNAIRLARLKYFSEMSDNMLVNRVCRLRYDNNNNQRELFNKMWLYYVTKTTREMKFTANFNVPYNEIFYIVYTACEHECNNMKKLLPSTFQNQFIWILHDLMNKKLNDFDVAKTKTRQQHLAIFLYVLHTQNEKSLVNLMGKLKYSDIESGLSCIRYTNGINDPKKAKIIAEFYLDNDKQEVLFSRCEKPLMRAAVNILVNDCKRIINIDELPMVKKIFIADFLCDMINESLVNLPGSDQYLFLILLSGFFGETVSAYIDKKIKLNDEMIKKKLADTLIKSGRNEIIDIFLASNPNLAAVIFPVIESLRMKSIFSRHWRLLFKSKVAHKLRDKMIYINDNLKSILKEFDGCDDDVKDEIRVCIVSVFQYLVLSGKSIFKGVLDKGILHDSQLKEIYGKLEPDQKNNFIFSYQEHFLLIAAEKDEKHLTTYLDFLMETSDMVRISGVLSSGVNGKMKKKLIDFFDHAKTYELSCCNHKLRNIALNEIVKEIFINNYILQYELLKIEYKQSDLDHSEDNIRYAHSPLGEALVFSGCAETVIAAIQFQLQFEKIINDSADDRVKKIETLQENYVDFVIYLHPECVFLKKARAQRNLLTIEDHDPLGNQWVILTYFYTPANTPRAKIENHGRSSKSFCAIEYEW